MPAEYPIVRLKRQKQVARRIASGRRNTKGHATRLPYDVQAKRLGKIFDSAAANLADISAGVDVSADPRAVVPERCLVFELNGAAYKFNVAAQALGLEWLLTEDADFNKDPGEDEADELSGDNAKLDTKAKLLYLTMPSDAALRELLKHWKKYSKGYDCPERLPDGHPKLLHLWPVKLLQAGQGGL